VEFVELIDDAIDLALLVLDRGGAGDLGVDHRRREDDCRNQYERAAESMRSRGHRSLGSIASVTNVLRS